MIVWQGVKMYIGRFITGFLRLVHEDAVLFNLALTPLISAKDIQRLNYQHDTSELCQIVHDELARCKTVTLRHLVAYLLGCHLKLAFGQKFPAVYINANQGMLKKR